MGSVAEQFTHLYAQRAAVEALILAGIAGAIGPWILMRGLGFFAHAIGSASFPGLIFADAVGLIPQAGAALGSVVVASGAGVVRPTVRNGTRTALWLTGSLAVGALIASNWSRAGAGVDAALFGSLLTGSWLDVITGAIALVAAATAARLAGPRWLAQGLLQRNPRHWDGLLLLVTAIAVIAQLPATGALLSSTMLILPAAAAQPWSSTIRGWQLRTLLVGVIVGLGGLTVSLGIDTPPGATIALLAGAAVVVSAAIRAATRRAMGTKALAGAAAAAATLSAGCGNATKAEVVTGTPIVASIAESVAGSNLAVKSLVPAGADPHEWEPRPSDTESLADSKLLILSGGGLDSWAERLHSRTSSDATVVDLFPTLPVRLTAEGSTDPDPHWFQDPTNAAAAATTIAGALAKVDPARADKFSQRAAKFAATARSLQEQGRKCVDQLSPNERRLITDHDAFQYLANRLGLTVQGSLLSSQSTAAAPTPLQLDKVLSDIRKYKVKAVFPERSLDSRLAKNIAREAQVRSDVQLDADTLGPAGAKDSTWAGMWTGNVERLVAALSGGRVNCHFKEKS